MDLTSLLTEWLNLLLRWTHFVIGIGWIGASLYFVWMDLAFRPRSKMNPGVSGTVWMVHGGGFYHVEKYQVAPEHLPEDLHWFKWEAYLTWVTGFALLILQYYWSASAYLIDPDVAALQPWQAIAISVVSLALGWLIYDGLCRSPLAAKPALLAAAIFALIVAAAYGYTQVFSGRGALIHIGALIGTMMAANVFMVIIPKQRRATKALLAGEAPDPRLGETAKQRSVHNNYLVLPVLLMMVSSHYPLLVGHPLKWLIAAFIVVVGAAVRHHINSFDKGAERAGYAWALPLAALALLGAIAVSAYRPDVGRASAEVSDAQALAIVRANCAVCHAARPTYEGFDEAPAGVRLDTLEDVLRQADRVRAQAVDSTAMPLGNVTGMSRDDRLALGAWLAARQ